MKKLFVVIPIYGEKEKDIIDGMNKALEDACKITGEELELIDQYHNGLPENKPHEYYLGNSIQLMAEADYVYLVDDFYNAKGCIAEAIIAYMYKKEIICENSTAQAFKSAVIKILVSFTTLVETDNWFRKHKVKENKYD